MGLGRATDGNGFANRAVSAKSKRRCLGIAVAGFSQCFDQLLTLLNDYEALQRERFVAMREQLLATLEGALYDAVILERIVAHLQSHDDTETTPTLFLPMEISPPPALSHLTCLPTKESHITLQVGTKALRFPVKLLCQQWIETVDVKTEHLDRQMREMILTAQEDVIDKLKNYKQ